VLALRPNTIFEQALDLAVLPARILGELARPLTLWQERVVFAANDVSREVRAREAFEREALEHAVFDSALSASIDLPSGGRGLHGEVIARAQGDLDRIVVRAAFDPDLVVGLPVVSGDYFVGVVASVSETSSGEWLELEVQLITDADARIGGLIREDQEGEECRLVVGGLAPRSDRIDLDLHNPSNRASASGRVIVHEPPELAEGATWLANGFVLGDLYVERGARGGAQRGLRPGLDYQTGLYQVLILLPARGASESVAALPTLRDEWTPVRFLLRADPSAWRAGRKLSIGRWSGILDGAAIASGTRIVGRVAHAGWLSSDVRLVGDRGFAVNALALLKYGDAEAPHVLGRIRSLGRDANGDLVFEWPAVLPLPRVAGTNAIPARIFTGSGERGVPRGLLLGDGLVPTGKGPHQITIRQPDGAREPATLLAFRATEGGAL